MPDMIFWRLPSGVILTSIFGPPELVAAALGRDHDRTIANRAVLRRLIPYGAEAWSESATGPWQTAPYLADHRDRKGPA